jgi:hypothetical protein
MERQKPDTSTNEIDLYIRTYYSLLRSSGDVRVRAFEEAHSYSNASLHPNAGQATPDIAAFSYAAGRLPEQMPEIRRVILGQCDETFARFGFNVADWPILRTRGRRRQLRHDGQEMLAAYIVSTSDIDDLLPILTAYQIEWNKMHRLLAEGRALLPAADDIDHLHLRLAKDLGVSQSEIDRLFEALGDRWQASLRALQTHPLDLSVRLLAGSFAEYQRAANLWWQGIETAAPWERHGRLPPIYFVSSNTHALPNLLGGYALAHRDSLCETARRENPDGIYRALEQALRADEDAVAANLLYFILRTYVHTVPGARHEVQRWDEASGIRSVENLAHVDVEAQVIELRRLRPERFDPRLSMPGLERLQASNAYIINIDYPLGMAAYHLLSRVGLGVGALLGVYVMGKAATLNGQVGDVLISRTVHDEHSENTYLFPNVFSAHDIAPYLELANVLDNQKAVTSRGPFLQNSTYMGVFYREGYTVLEMEAGPYLSAIYELGDPRRYPNDEVVNLGERIGFDLGFLHYASDTPYSRRQSLLSKSLSVFGMESTYACATAIVRRILTCELARLAVDRAPGCNPVSNEPV